MVPRVPARYCPVHSYCRHSYSDTVWRTFECETCGGWIPDLVYPGDRCEGCYNHGLYDPTHSRSHEFRGSGAYRGDVQLCVVCLSPSSARIHEEDVAA